MEKLNRYSIEEVIDSFKIVRIKESKALKHWLLHEFKRSKGDSHDPEGQMLAAMILAQELNPNTNPLYGC